MSFEAKFIQDGKAIDYIPSAAVSAGAVVKVGPVVGVAKLDIAANERGALALEGVYEVAKSSGAITLGQYLYWDNTNKRVAASGDFGFGIAVEAATSDATAVRVLINAPAGGDDSSN